MKITHAFGSAGVLCAVALGARVDIMPIEQAAKYKALLPEVDSTELSAILKSPETMWYDSKSIVPGYQDSMSDPEGFRPNTIEPVLIDTAVPGGWRTLFSERGHFHFPFNTGGADLSDNMVKINFWWAPKQGSNTLPVVYWKLGFSRWQWMFPAGTKLGEVLLIRFPDSELRVFEIRVRTRTTTSWINEVYRPFLTSEELLDAIKRVRPDWFMVDSLKNLINYLWNTETLTPRSLSTQAFPGTFSSASGYLDVIPDFDNAETPKQLLTTALFRSVGSTPWKSNGTKTTYAAGTKSAYSIVPKNYDGGMLPVDDVSCRRCHSDAGRQIGEFHDQLVAYGELWGEDEIFSWHPFETSAFVKPDGSVANFNNDNRRLRQDFVNAGLVATYNPGTHPASIYKKLPRSWEYTPISFEEKPSSDDTAASLACENAKMTRVSDGKLVANYPDQTICESSRLAAHGGVVCAYFTPGMPIGPGGWDETGWRPMNVNTKLGLGRRPLASHEQCLSVTSAANGGIVCTNTGLGAKPTNIQSNLWCGASAQLKYCLDASRAAIGEVACSFPSDGTGAEAGWVRTRFTGDCDYEGGKQTLESCNASIVP